MELIFKNFEKNKKADTHQHAELKKYLNDGYSPNIRYSNDSFLLLEASRCGDLKISLLLLKFGADVNIKTNLGITSAMLAYDKNILNLLLDYNADINIQDYRGNTALHWSALSEDKEQIDILLKAGANPALKNNEGQTYKDLLNYNH